MNKTVYCAIYKSAKKLDTYLYMATKDDFSRVPEALLDILGKLIYVFDLELTSERKLAREDVNEVMRNLHEQGWHLQMPQKEYWFNA